MSLYTSLWVGLLAVVLLAQVLTMLKGTLGFVRALARETWQRRGEQWVQYALVEPILFIPFAFFSSALRLAHPDSAWARWSYGERKTARAQERYDAESAPTVLTG